MLLSPGTIGSIKLLADYIANGRFLPRAWSPYQRNQFLRIFFHGFSRRGGIGDPLFIDTVLLDADGNETVAPLEEVRFRTKLINVHERLVTQQMTSQQLWERLQDTRQKVLDLQQQVNQESEQQRQIEEVLKDTIATTKTAALEHIGKVRRIVRTRTWLY